MILSEVLWLGVVIDIGLFIDRFHFQFKFVMGNKSLRPSQFEPFSGFNDDQIGYLKDKYDHLCNENHELSVEKIAEELNATNEEATKILNYIDFQGTQAVDFYEFICAAASLHQNDAEARQFIFQIYAEGKEITQYSFTLLFATVFKYLKSMDLIHEEYKPEMAAAKFKKYDFNKNESLSYQQFEEMLQNDFHLKMWLETLGFAKENPKQPEQKILNHELERDEIGLDEDSGDQFMATNAWTKVAETMSPIPKSQWPEDKSPNLNLDISYVYGYRSYDTRDNLRYNSQGQIVYHTAACGIVLNKGKNTMKVNTTHNDDITCLDINENSGLVATGEMGRYPSIVIWDSTTTQSKIVFDKKLQKNISNICLSKSGKYVAASSMNDKHEIAVYDIQKNALVCHGQGPKSVIFAIKFNKAEDQIVCACQKEVVFCKFTSSAKLQIKKGIFGKAPLNPNLAIAVLNDSVITSMTNGLLIQWKGNNVSKIFKEHTKSVGALCERKQGGIISGDASGTIIVWSSNMSKERQISLQKLLGNVKSNNIRLISLCEQNGNILAGTRGGQIIQVTKYTNANVLMEGHYDKQLWGLCTSTSKNEFFTGGEDKLLIKWDALKRKVLLKKKLEYPIKTIDINRQNQLAVGQRNGVITVFDGNNFNTLRKMQDHKNPDRDVVSIVKFSPEGTLLAVGYCPPISRVYLYDLKVEKVKKVGQCKGASTRIVSIDFAMGGDSLLATSIEPLFYKTANCAQITAVSSLKTQQWASMNSKYMWFTQGIWPPSSDGSDVNAVDRSNGKKFLASADDFSKVKVFRYPVCHKKQMYNEYKGHSSHVTGVKWSFDDKNVFSIGGLEKSIIQWNVNEYGDISYDVQEKVQKEEVAEDNEEYEFADQQQEQKEKGEFQVEVDQGDQALAVKPFLGQVKASIPLNYRPTHKNEPPTEDLLIKHVWGVRNLYINDRVRNQVRYSRDGKSCVFITAALGVQMNINSLQQSFYKGQSDDLISFAMTKDRRYCATGQMAELNKSKPTDKIVDVHIWDAETKEKKVVLAKFHKRAVVLVQFSPSGKRILTVGQDDKNSLAVYDWETNRLAWSSPVDGAKVNGAAWKSETDYMTVGFKHAKMWNQGKGTMQKINGKWDPMISVVCWSDKFVSGSSGGNVYFWAGGAGQPTKCSQGTVDCLAVDLKGNLLSGCSKGLIKQWKITGGKLVSDKTLYEMGKFQTVDAGVLSIDFFKDQMLVCTNSSSIYQLSSGAKQAEPIMTGHYKGELWAESWSPDKESFVTGGDDRTIRIFDIKSYKQKSLFKMKEQVRGIDWEQSKGELIVVGDYKGKIYLFDTELNLLDEGKTKFSKTKPRQEPFWIEDIKFSPDGKYVAFGAHGGASHLQIFEIKDNKFVPKSIIVNAGMTSALLSVDWSKQSDTIVCVSQAYQLKFCNLSGAVSASSTRTTQWATWSAKFGFCVQEIHQDVDYSNINCVATNPTKSLIATGGDDQKVRLFTYPATIPKQKNKEFTGHSSHVTKVRFSADQQYLLSVGGNDRTIILWEVSGHEKQEQVKEQKEQQQEEQEDEQFNQDAQDVEDYPKPRSEVKADKSKVTSDEIQLDQDEGDQFGASKPWMGAIKEPTTSYYKGSGKAPQVDLYLQYAHGYRTKDCRNNLKYLSEKEICYHTAGLGIVMDIESYPRQQNFFDAHTDDIISMAWNEDKTEMFTGQMGAKPVIHRWDKECGKPLKSYKGVKKGVSAIAVNKKYLVASGLDDDHYVYVFDIESGALVASEKGGRDVILGMKWAGQNAFVSIGVKHYKYWQFGGKTVKGKSGAFNKNCNILCSVQVAGEKIYTGASDGSLLVWGANSVLKAQKVHKGAINALCIINKVILTGSNDKTISILKLDTLQVLTKINCQKLFQSSVNKSIRAIDAMGNRLIVGTLGSEIYELQSKHEAIEDCNGKSEFKLKGNYMNGHFAPNYVTNEVWGLSLYEQDKYITCSDDGTLRVWDIEKRQQIIWIDLKFDDKLKKLTLKPTEKFLPDSVKGRCTAVSQDNYVVIGCKDGTVRILDSDFKPKYCSQISKKEISHIKFSPDGTILAIGAHDTVIYLYSWKQGTIKLKGKCNKHTSYIKHFDFTKDGNYMHSTSGDYELLFWDTNTGKQVTGGASLTRDYEWATWNVTLGWPVQGIWEQFTDGTDINAIDRSKKTYGGEKKIVATGNDSGTVRILEYPCLVKNSESVKGRGHSSHVTNVLFNLNDELLFTTGGEDQTVLQWKIE